MTQIASTANHVRILIVDDQEPMRQLLRVVLRGMGISDIDEARNGSEALAKLCDPDFVYPDIVLCDLHLMEMSGTEFIRRLRCSRNAIDPGVPVIVLTGQNEERALDVASQVGANAVRRKPVSPRLLCRDIEEIVGYRLASRRNRLAPETAWCYAGKGFPAE